MSAEEQTGVGIVVVPNSQVDAVRKYAASLVDEDTPDIEGYAAMIKGIGGSIEVGGAGVSQGILMADGPCGTDCKVTTLRRDFNCGDGDE
jgi:hypothetical protein